MKNFKRIDFWISVILITVFTAGVFIDRSRETLFWGYVTVGAWQVVSMIVHTLTGYFTQKGRPRFIYHCISFIALITIPAGSVWILAFIAPFMAVYYSWMCYNEVFIKMKRPMDLLK
ncbi:MAG: hypothetical protein IPP72_02475 [Chitinophagaceae bacterium]|nr:hypothetical protein [Chitinophagaceae bacterium]